MTTFALRPPIQGKTDHQFNTTSACPGCFRRMLPVSHLRTGKGEKQKKMVEYIKMFLCDFDRDDDLNTLQSLLCIPSL